LETFRIKRSGGLSSLLKPSRFQIAKDYVIMKLQELSARRVACK